MPDDRNEIVQPEATPSGESSETPGQRAPTRGDLGRAIGRYTESEGGDSAETLNAHRGLFDAYDAWVDAGRPEHDARDDRAALEAVARRLLDGWEPTAYFWLDARYDRPDSPLTPEEAHILDLLRKAAK